ncbi:MAG TPA: teicoplanin resistance protein VanZ, partial [Burkholderiales bacterium]
MDAAVGAPRGSNLARILFLVYVLLVAYASLYPLSGWRDVGLSPFAYLSAPWPRYVTVFDIVVNVVGYLPFGFLAVMALHPQVRAVGAVAAAIAGATLLSLVLEA